MPSKFPIPVGLAISATDVALSVGTCEPYGLEAPAPPAAILPIVRGETAQASSAAKLDQVGSGLSWPAAASVSNKNGAGRLPAVYAWRLIEQVKSRWSWSLDDTVHTITGAEAIAAIAQGCLEHNRLETH